MQLPVVAVQQPIASSEFTQVKPTPHDSGLSAWSLSVDSRQNDDKVSTDHKDPRQTHTSYPGEGIAHSVSYATPLVHHSSPVHQLGVVTCLPRP